MALTFPVGAMLSLINAFDILRKGEVLGGWSSVVFGVIVFILFGVNLFYKHLMHWVELVFFYTIAFYLFVMAIDKINFFAANIAQGDAVFLSALTEVTLWVAIVYVASYLALSSTQNSAFMLISLGSLFLALLYHMIFKNGFRAAIVLLWVRELFALFVLVLLITQTGRLNKDYAAKDDLTGAYNRREVYQALHREMDRAARYNKPFSIILFDVDHFKNINDTYGHIVGDNVLKGIAALVNKTIRRTDCLGRWGGEEFLIVLPETDSAFAARLAEKICEVIRLKRFETINRVTASFGVTTYQPGQDIEAMLHSADTAMYQAKQAGRDRVIANL